MLTLPFSTDAAREALVKQHFANCSEDLKRVILSCRDELIIRQLFMLPVDLTWEHCPGVTLLGDAAHCTYESKDDGCVGSDIACLLSPCL